MPYWLYESIPGKLIYTKRHEIPLFGYREGLIYHAVKMQLPKALEVRKGFFWTRTALDLLTGRHFDPDRHAAVIDFAPDRPDPLIGVIRGIAGHTDEWWTPFIVLCDVIENASDAAKTELDFEEVESRCCTVLYAQGGWGEHAKKWIPQGHGGITAAILWPAAFEYFASAGLEWVQNGKITSETRCEL